LCNIGLAYMDLGEPRSAVEFHEQYLAIAREIGYRRGEGIVLGNMGGAYIILGELRRAIKLFEQQLAINREIGYRRGEGNALGCLGLAYAGLGEPYRAIEFHEQNLAIAREIGDRRGESYALGNMGTPTWPSASPDAPSTLMSKSLPSPERSATGGARPTPVGILALWLRS